MEVNETALKELLQNSRKQVEILERILEGKTTYQNNERVSVPKNLVTNSDIRFNKDEAYLKILRGSAGLNEWQISFLDNVISSNYTSLTAKQKEVIDGIAKQTRKNV